MNYIKINNKQLNTLKSLPNNLNDKINNQNVSGLIIIDRLNQFKQIIIDFQTTSLEELYVDKQSSTVKLNKHIKNDNPRLYRAITFDVVNSSPSNNQGIHINSSTVPSIEQWIKCTLHSVVRKIFNHIVITPSDNIYCISIKKTHYYDIYHKKLENNWKLRELLHYLIKFYTELYYENDFSKIEIPEKFNSFFDIEKCKNNSLSFYYKSYNENLAKVL